MAITFEVGQIRRFRPDGRNIVFAHSFQIQSIDKKTALVFGNCCHDGATRIENQHEHTYAELIETELIEPVLAPAPVSPEDECACGWKRTDSVHGSCRMINCTIHTQRLASTHRLEHHDFVSPHPPAANASADTEAARGGEAAVTTRSRLLTEAEKRRILRMSDEAGPSVVAVTQAREPWRPTVDEYDLLPDAETGWRR